MSDNIMYLEQLNKVIEGVEDFKLAIPDIKRTVDLIYFCSGIVYLAGNGGSAAVAQHLAADLVRNAPCHVVSLVSNACVLTALTNDIGGVFNISDQFIRKCTDKDILIVFSVSGNSPNIQDALVIAADIGMTTIAIVGRNGEELDGEDVSLVIPVDSRSYEVVEDVFSVICHMIKIGLIAKAQEDMVGVEVD